MLAPRGPQAGFGTAKPLRFRHADTDISRLVAFRDSTPRAYRFGDYRIDPAARELRHGDQLLPLPRRVFDGLAYLIEHRERAVGHDELISALWGRVDVTNAQLSQLIMQVRRAIGDDSQTQHGVRTIAGFGYRWVMATDAVGAVEATAGEPAAQVASTDVDTMAGADLTVVPPPERRKRGHPKRMLPVVVAVVLALLALALLAVGWKPQGAHPPPGAGGDAVVVLPFDIDAPEDIDASWARLGLMDLVASRLRRAGLPVPPSDGVVSAVHATTTLPAEKREAALRRTLGADLLVHGIARHARDGWTIELTAEASRDLRRRVDSGPHELVDSARRASDLLLASLGRQTGDEADIDASLEERLQRTQAALLANQLNAARATIESAPEAMRATPELRYELARVEFHAGKLDRAETITENVLADPAAAAMPRLRARALRMRGWIAIGKDRGWAAAEPSFDASVKALEGQRAPSDLGMALAERGAARVMLRQLDEAALDLGQARAQLEIAGDRKTLGEMNNYLGHLELAHFHVEAALPRFRVAADIAESFGSIDSLRYNLSALLQSQMRLLRWSDALATGERLWALRERLENPGLRAASDGYYALALLGNGRQAEAERVLAPYATYSQPAFPGEYLRFAFLARAELAAARGSPQDSLAAATRALEVWPPHAEADAQERARAALLVQRASLASGKPVEARIDTLEPHDDPAVAVPDLVAQAEWAAAGHHDTEAEALFRQATETAEKQGVPDMILLATEAFVPWLVAHGRTTEAQARSGRVGIWAERDFDSAVLQVKVFHAGHETEAWTRALQQARKLAGERVVPAQWSSPPETEAH